MRIFDFDEESYSALSTWCSMTHHPDKMCRMCWEVFEFAEFMMEGLADIDGTRQYE